MYRIDGTCVKSDILIKMLDHFGWTYKVSPGKSQKKTVRFTKVFGSQQNAAEARSLLHKRLVKHEVIAVFGMIYFDKDAEL